MHNEDPSINSLLRAGVSSITQCDRPCPFCYAEYENINDLHLHVAYHLERFSIFALPRSHHIDKDEDINDGEAGSNHVNIQRNESLGEDDSIEKSSLAFESQPSRNESSAAYSVTAEELRTGTHAADDQQELPAANVSAQGGEYNSTLKEAEAAAGEQKKVVEVLPGTEVEEHPDTLYSMADQASTYQNQGLWTEAENLQMQVMAMRRVVLGQEHPETLSSIADLASTYQNQGRLTEAEELEVQVMETRKKVLGEEHPDTLTSMANLASTYRNQGRWKKAEELNMQVMETRKRMLGEEHPDTLTSMANLASTFSNQGRWKEAEELEVQVMETRKRVLGEEHPDTLTSMANLASTFSNQGRWKEAEELEVQVMETRKRVLGEEHPDTLTIMNNLAFTWKGQGRGAEALKLIEECIQLQTRILGVDHLHTLSSSATRNGWQTKRLETDASTAKVSGNNTVVSQTE
jgi:tetratricopeptide (TPR) repeat protein